jgi:hypothetical protein
VCHEDDPQARRVDEVQVLEVEYDHRRCANLRAPELALQDRHGGQIEFATQAQHHSVLLAPDIYAKLILNSHIRMLAHGLRVPASLARRSGLAPVILLPRCHAQPDGVA